MDGAMNPEKIHQYVQGLTLSRMPFAALEADRHHQPHGCRNAQMGRITYFIFKEDRAGKR
jgi:hypothetical protein